MNPWLGANLPYGERSGYLYLLTVVAEGPGGSASEGAARAALVRSSRAAVREGAISGQGMRG
jgi:hypothetical protein